MAKKDKAPAKNDAPEVREVPGYREWKPADLERATRQMAGLTRQD